MRPPDILFHDPEGDEFAHGFCSAGDVNGDGYDDLLISDCYKDAPFSYNGVAYLYYGGKTPNNISDATLKGKFDKQEFGYSLSGLGDINFDGYDDFIIGAPYESSDADIGRAYIYRGGQTFDTFEDGTIMGHSKGDDFGYDVDLAGDVNGDGCADIVTGAPGENGSTGNVYVHSTRSGMRNLTFSAGRSRFRPGPMSSGPSISLRVRRWT